ncbi:MAG: carbohydrate ABC transporter permease [Candidatus Brocadiaceae bacterium]|jgi:multiple sugar transport system permease protein
MSEAFREASGDRRRRGGRRSPWTLLVYLVLIAFAGTTIFPFLWVVGAAFRPTEDITSKPLQIFPDPRDWTLSPEFRPDDIRNFSGLCSKVVEQAGAAEPSPGRRVWHFLSPDGRRLFHECASGTELSEPIRSRIVAALNSVLGRRGLYREEYFKAVAVPDEADDLLQRGPDNLSEGKVRRLNRLILQAAYYQEVREARGPFDNFRRALSMVPFARFFLNSLLVAVAVTVGQVATSACAAYAFARLRFPGRDKLFLGYLATLMVPWTVVMIPTFVMMKLFGWIDTLWALTIPAMFSAYGTFMLRQFFLGIPTEYEEAAKIDGCSYFGIFWHVILPLSKPALATLALFTFIGSWNNLIAPLVFIVSEEKMTLPLGLTRFQGLRDADWGALMAGSLMMLIPMIVLFAVGQRFFTRGIRLSAGKG